MSQISLLRKTIDAGGRVGLRSDGGAGVRGTGRHGQDRQTWTGQESPTLLQDSVCVCACMHTLHLHGFTLQAVSMQVFLISRSVFIFYLSDPNPSGLVSAGTFGCLTLRV